MKLLAVMFGLTAAMMLSASSMVKDLRGYGKLELETIAKKNQCTVSRFTAESPEKAKLTASKYLADLQNYGAVAKNPDGTVSVRHGGIWKLGLKDKYFYVIHAPNAAALEKCIVANKLKGLAPVPEKAYPAYLDNFDNRGLCFWWKAFTKTKEEMEFLKNSKAGGNHHFQMGNTGPYLKDYSGYDNAEKQFHDAGISHRTMIFGSTGWTDVINWKDGSEQNEPGFVSRSIFFATGYYKHQVVNSYGELLFADQLRQFMEAKKDDPMLMAWMEPHGEFIDFFYRRIPDADIRFRDHLKKKYTSVSALNKAWGTPGKYQTWDEVKYLPVNYFYGRRNSWVDLDDIDWRWKVESLEKGIESGFVKADFDAGKWFLSNRVNDRFSAYGNKRFKVKTPLWARFQHQVPADFRKNNQKIWLHLMPYTNGGFQALSIWINGKQVADKSIDKKQWNFCLHRSFDVTSALKDGTNDFVIWNQGGPILYSVFLSNENDSSYPFKSAGMNQQYLDWTEAKIAAKNGSMERFLSLMRTVDPVRPIKVMTPRDGFYNFELFEKYGAYPQLTGEGSFYRPMHYKGYAALRNRTSSSEMAGPSSDPFGIQKIMGYMMFENQDMHDYGFDMAEAVTRIPAIKDWWVKNLPLMATVGKVDFNDRRLGVLRDMEQDNLYGTGEIWHWDMSRGSFPALGFTPVLINGGDMIAGYANGPVKVIWDCSTNVMKPELVKALRKYIEQGGIFVASFNTGMHSPVKRHTWDFFKSFDMKVKEVPFSSVTFEQNQNLFPSLRGRTCSGKGYSADHVGTEFTGAIAFEGKNLKPVARWQDGSLAVAELTYGKGKMIILGTPFWAGLRDENGKWINQKNLLSLVEDVLVACGLKSSTKVIQPDRAVWMDKRVSKNGLYDVYFACDMCFDKKNPRSEKLEPVDSCELLVNQTDRPVIDVTTAGTPDVKTSMKNGWQSLGEQKFSAHQIRQFASIRDNVGETAPRQWLKQQECGWFKLKNPEKYDLEKARKATEDYAKKIGFETVNISEGWDAVLNFNKKDKAQKWEKKTTIGTWFLQGFPETTESVCYSKEIKLPKEWSDGKHRVFLNVHSPKYCSENLRLFLNEKTFAKNNEIPEAVVNAGSFKLTAEDKNAKDKFGSQCMVYLTVTPKPKKIMKLNGPWTEYPGPLENGKEFNLPFKGKLYGMGTKVMIPADWNGRVIRYKWNGKQGFSFIMINGTRVRRLDNSKPGVRLDGMLEYGKENRIEVYVSTLDYGGNPASVQVKEIALEVY